VKYAGFWRRLLALILDCIIVYIISAIAGFIIGFIYGLVTGGPQGVQVIGFILGLVINWLYFALQESSAKMATLGKQALGIVVTDLDGQRISFGKATARHFSKILSGLILLIGYIMAAFTEKEQALHDILAGTLVVKQDSR